MVVAVVVEEEVAVVMEGRGPLSELINLVVDEEVETWTVDGGLPHHTASLLTGQ